MSRLRIDRSPSVPRLRLLRTYWVVVILCIIGLWPFGGLTIPHLIFFGALSMGLYASYSRYILPLIVYFSMILLYWIVVPFLQDRIGVGYYTWRGDVPDFGPMALLFVMTHFLGILAGFQFKRISLSHKEIPELGFSFVGVAFILALLVALMAFVGFETIMLPRVEQETGEAQNYVILLRNIAKILPAFLVAYFILEADNGLKKNTRVAIFILLASCLLIVSNPVNTSRFLSLFGLFVVILTYSIKSSRLSVLAWLLAFAPAYAITLLGITSAMRSGIQKVDLTRAFQSLQSLEFSSYSIFLDALKLDSFSQGNYLFSHLFIIVPRAIWPGKAESIGIYTAERSGYVYNNVGLNSFFNSYADFGFVGLFLFSMLFGVLAKNLNPTFELASFRNRRFMYGVLFTGMTPMFFRGDLSTAMLALYPAILVYEAIRFSTRFRFMSGVR